jgi:hypothetical protein
MDFYGLRIKFAELGVRYVDELSSSASSDHEFNLTIGFVGFAKPPNIAKGLKSAGVDQIFALTSIQQAAAQDAGISLLGSNRSCGSAQSLPP